MRSIDATLSLYFRRADAKYFAEGAAGNEVTLELVFGNAVGYRMVFYAKKAKLTVPTVNFGGPAVEISMGLKMLGTDGEDSLEIRFE